MIRQPMVDLVVGPQAYHRLPSMAAKAGNGVQVLDTEFPEEDKFEFLPRGTKARRAPAAFLTVQEGCDKFCAFCVVPYTRGAEVSRPAERLLAEARDLVERGVVEISLLGQNVNAYLADEWTLARLIRDLAKIDGLERIRYMTSHPNDMGDDLIAVHGEVEKLMPYLHLPVQSGSDEVLKAMNRKHTAVEYLRFWSVCGRCGLISCCLATLSLASPARMKRIFRLRWTCARRSATGRRIVSSIRHDQVLRRRIGRMWRRGSRRNAFIACRHC